MSTPKLPAGLRALGVKTFTVTGVNSHDGTKVQLPFTTVTAADAASARRKAFRKLGGFTIGYKIKVKQDRTPKEGLGRIGTPATAFDSAVHNAVNRLLAGDCDTAQHHAGTAQRLAKTSLDVRRSTKLQRAIQRCHVQRG